MEPRQVGAYNKPPAYSKQLLFSISPAGDMLCGGGYLGEKPGYGGVGGVYSSNYGCYYTNMDYLSPAMGHSPINVPPVSQHVYLCFYPGKITCTRILTADLDDV